MRFDKILSIDPGSSGGIAIYHKGTVLVQKMPADVKELHKIVAYHSDNCKPVCFLEKVQVFMSDSDEENKGKQFNIAKMLANYESLKTILAICGMPFIEVAPRTWQSQLNLVVKGESKTERKQRYKRAAKEYYPNINVTNWNGDALCILQFGMRKVERNLEWVLEKLGEKTGLF